MRPETPALWRVVSVLIVLEGDLILENCAPTRLLLYSASCVFGSVNILEFERDEKLVLISAVTLLWRGEAFEREVVWYLCGSHF